jgi:hypothetical protein
MQRYVSSELTHFIGRLEQTEEKQYNFLKSILSDGLLKSGFDDKTELHISINDQIDLSTNEVYKQNMVCFCDIPYSDLKIHMKKYSKFGISFKKEALIKKGATPIFYISQNSKVYHMVFDQLISNSEVFDFWHKKTLELHNKRIENIDDDTKNDLWGLLTFFQVHIFSFMKFFDPELPEDDEKNYYMEREWRKFGNINFTIDEVHSVIIPQSYCKQFKKDFPDYCGQLLYADN